VGDVEIVRVEDDDVALPSDRLLAELTEAGFPPDEVDTVVNTHGDGLGGNTWPDAA